MESKEKNRLYRVWHTDKKTCSKFDTKEIEEVHASSIKEAKKIVTEMYPDHRVTSAWLVQK
ncbi:hypothetical protein [Acetivibrio mesophilus]|uniref:Uncharacterized protein n=1 Tax=Acetivibrio mesophilus TaxID=2487273 RepID=A0A4Q0I4Q7_9FIRM|nr:hypothetical protein [Acetivibrio mesophilus]ODM26845.1 hypothetical protein A7W90_11825 [Clostridium sp. Bc-iso-3]RXE59290.1 hypothetical protein EFD62_07935 [Acetivibrio mesophilus]HHV28363.1 hypothetical protein [Clostridium sp.]